MADLSVLSAYQSNREYLTEEHLMFRDSLRKFLEKEAIPHFDQWEADGLVPVEFWKKLGENGFLCPWVDEKYGGLNADFIFSIILTEEIARVGAGLSGIALHNGIVAPYIDEYGTEEQKQKYLPGCISGDIITAVAMTEPGTGSDLANITATAIKDGDHYIVNGQKTFISNGINGNLIVLAVKTDPNAEPKHRGISLLLVDADNTPGFSRGRNLDKVGMRSQDTAELIFEDARVPVENLLGEEGKGFYYLMNKLQQERIISVLRAQVMSEEMLRITVDYVKDREAFGKPIGKFQNTQFKIAEMLTSVQLGRTFIDNLIVRHMRGENIVAEISMAKWWISETARQLAPQCMQLHGGYGYMEEYEIARMYRDIAANAIFAGTNEIMKVIIAKEIGL